MSRLAAAARARSLRAEEPEHAVAEVVGLDQDIESENQDGQEAEQAAHHTGDRAHDRADCLAAARFGRAFDRLTKRQMLAQEPLANEELLPRRTCPGAPSTTVAPGRRVAGRS